MRWQAKIVVHLVERDEASAREVTSVIYEALGEGDTASAAHDAAALKLVSTQRAGSDLQP